MFPLVELLEVILEVDGWKDACDWGEIVGRWVDFPVAVMCCRVGGKEPSEIWVEDGYIWFRSFGDGEVTGGVKAVFRVSAVWLADQCFISECVRWPFPSQVVWFV